MGNGVQKESLSVPLYEEVSLMSGEARPTAVRCHFLCESAFPCNNHGTEESTKELEQSEWCDN